MEEFGQSFKSLKDKINEILEPKSMRPSSPHGNISPNDMPPIPQAPNGKISIEIKSQNPLRVTSMSASSGEIEVKNIRSGMHFT